MLPTKTASSHLHQPILPILLTLLLAPSLLAVVSANTNTDQYYCGLSWPDAADNCHRHCPSGGDAECISALGEEFGCFYFTGCTEATWVEDEDEDEEEFEQAGMGNNNQGQGGANNNNNNNQIVANNNFCGTNWLDAMATCSENCPMGFECSNPDETCFSATNCDRPIETLVSNLMATLAGPDSAMDESDIEIFSGTVFEEIAAAAGDSGVALGDVNVGDQNVVGRRELQRRMDRRALLGHDHYMHYNLNIQNITQRRLPSGSSAIDVSMVVTGDYRPPPYVDLNVIAEDSINRNGQKVVNTLRERGERAGRSDFFSRVEGIEAVRLEDKTERPTRAPVDSPTLSPEGDPTSRPSGMPTYSPSSIPSSTPSRAHDQVIMTGSREDLQIGGETTSSYGYVFNIRTKIDSPVVVINGFDFYTLTTEDVTFELWSRMGSFADVKGQFDGWDLIASGTVQGRGVGRYTAIPEELYTPVSIPGGGGEGGTRAFYLTLNSINLVYKLGERGGGSDEKHHAETPELEIWEGEGVLFYPFPDPKDAFFYRYPRQYLGAIYYDRLPCAPYSLYGPVSDLPCPLVPTQSPTLTPPTKSPVTATPSTSPIQLPTESPTTRPPTEGSTPAPVEPTDFPTVSPTLSKIPTMRPTTLEPTLSPLVPMRANIITTLRNVPERNMTPREIEKYLEILTTFLNRHTGGSMTLDGIDLWHAKLVEVDAKEGTVVTVDNDEDDDPSAPQVARGATRHRFLERKKKIEPIITPQVTAMEVTLILRISLSNLPLNLLGNLANVAIAEHEQELLDLLHEQQAFYTFFREMDGVIGRTLVGEVTNPPSMSPTSVEYYLARQAELEAGPMLDEEEDTGVGFGVFVGVGIGLLWCCLTAVSVAYLMRRRGEMEEQRDMENLLKAEKANPLDDATPDGDDDDDDDSISVKSGKKLNRSSTVPMGNDDSDSSLFDQTNNPRLSIKAKDELTKSMKAGDGEVSGELKKLGEESLFDQTNNPRLSTKARVELTQSMKAGDGEVIQIPSSGELKKLGEEANGQQQTRGYVPKRTKRQGGGGMAQRSMIVTSQESKAMMLQEDLQDVESRRKSAGDVARNGVRKSRRNGGGMAGKSMIMTSGDIKAALAKNDEKILKTSLKHSATKGGGERERRAFAQSMVAPRSSGSDMGGLRRSAKKHGSKDNLSNLARSATTKRHGSNNNLASMRRSTKHHGSSDSLRRSSAAIDHGSNDINAEPRRSGNKRSSTGDVASMRKSTTAKGGNMNPLRRSDTEVGSKRSSAGDLASMRKSATVKGRSTTPLRRSDTEVRKPSRRRSGNLGRSMIT